MASVYESLAVISANPRARARLETLAETERRHAQAWADLLASCGVKVSERRPYMTARVLAALARVVGIGPALALAGLAEGQVLRAYLSQVSTVSNTQAQGVLRRVLPEELDHQSPDDVAERPEDERSPVVADEEWHGGGAESIRNVIYGVNDGLTATLGVLAGVGGASIDPRVVLIGGLSAMVAVGVSMAGRAYLATKAQPEVVKGHPARDAAQIEAMPALERAELVDI